MIRLTVPSIDDQDLRAVSEVLASGYLVQGPRVAAFEQAVATYVGTQHAVAVSNCTAALHLGLLALGVGPGDLVVVAPYSWPATANVIELCGAQPVFVDIRRDTFNLDPAKLAETLDRLMRNPQQAPRVKAILPVHTFGQMADMPAILEIAQRYNLPVIEDAACALGAAIQGRKAGTWGVMGCFSFHPRKAITTGEGGIVTTNDPALVRRLRALRNHGLDPESPAPEFILPGFNYRLTEFQAALGITQMAKLDRIIAARRRQAAVYDRLFNGTVVQPPTLLPQSQPVYQSYVVRLPAAVASHRSAIIHALKQQAIETSIGTWHIPMTAYFRERYGYKAGDFPAADEVFSRTLTLPLYEAITDRDQQVVARELERLAASFQGV